MCLYARVCARVCVYVFKGMNCMASILRCGTDGGCHYGGSSYRWDNATDKRTSPSSQSGERIQNIIIFELSGSFLIGYNMCGIYA